MLVSVRVFVSHLPVNHQLLDALVRPLIEGVGCVDDVDVDLGEHESESLIAWITPTVDNSAEELGGTVTVDTEHSEIIMKTDMRELYLLF